LAVLAVAVCLALAGLKAIAESAESAPAGREVVRQFWRHYREATKHRVAGDAAASLAAYERALALLPKHEDALYYAGNAAFEQGQYGKAEACWRLLVETNPLSARGHAQLGALYSCGLDGTPFDLGRATTEFSRTRSLNRQESGALYKLAEVAVIRGDTAAAHQDLQAVLQTNPRNAEALFLLGYLEWEAGDWKSATARLSQALEAAGGTDRPAGDSASNEGDTKRGSGPLLADGARYAGVVSAEFRRLLRGPEADIDSSYLRLQAHLAAMRTWSGTSTAVDSGGPQPAARAP